MFDGPANAALADDGCAAQATAPDARSGPRFDAILRPWGRYRIGAVVVLVGVVYGDASGRFGDGRMIRTSPLLKPELAGAGRIVATRNSRYLLIGPEHRVADGLGGPVLDA